LVVYINIMLCYKDKQNQVIKNNKKHIFPGQLFTIIDDMFKCLLIFFPINKSIRKNLRDRYITQYSISEKY
jgi:hypothetical protein